ncbi:sulfur carrier protein ThiS [Chelatococcus sp. SYSU_G07232]|uniref:Sulfur carrier protein ThiS n=1 Tax=Chelatococcus albus TaxID=3047466 RepID=A0ABT7ABV5_9HYPH|nr:sulfur carrier protein ThiS [Chelatococcus sp. SYSU_G07232]MDJ1156846.1 sulfur carrier protein ThiS [Chelatococcus sp. SYSU_G07232]
MDGQIRVNGENEALTVRTLAELVAAKGLSAEGRGVAVAVNGAVVRRAEWAGRELRAGDAVEIVQARQGG